VTRFPLLLIGLLATGCASVPRPAQQSTSAEREYTEASAAALAFDPPMTANAFHPELARGPREPSAILGYEDSTVESYTTVSDNLESSPFGDAYAKESVTVKSGNRSR
jgi:hypothetical protein